MEADVFVWELKDAREYVAGVDNIVAVDSDVAELTKKEAPKEKVEPLKPFKPIAKVIGLHVGNGKH